MSEIVFTNAPDIQRRLAAAPDAIKQQVMKRVARDIIRLNKERTKRQIDVEGQQFIPHKRHRSKKMLLRLSGKLKISNEFQEGILIRFNRRVDEAIAAVHQYGISQPAQAYPNNLERTLSRGEQASRTLAKDLLLEGYKRRIAGKAAKKPSIKWIVENMTREQAWLILRLLRIQNGTDNTLINGMPQRSILGVSDSDVAFLTAIALAEAEAAMAQT